MELSERPESDFDNHFLDAVQAVALKQLGAGRDAARVSEALEASIGPALLTIADSVTDSLRKDSARMLKEHNKLRRGFQSRLRSYWGPALDTYYAAVVCCRELAADCTGVSVGTKAEVLSRIVARSCRTALEVHHLLSGGFASGALARCRTLHELAVTAIVISDKSDEPNGSDIAERFLLHDVVTNHRDVLEQATVYEAYSNDAGPTPQEVAESQEARDSILARYGRDFQKDNAWASRAIGRNVVSFRDLEAAAGLSYLRRYYQWASHEVHGDSKGARMNILERDGVAIKLAGETNFDLAEPGHLALISLQQAVNAFVLDAEYCSAKMVVAARAIQQLVDEAGVLFENGAKLVAEAERRYQDAAAKFRPSK